MRPDWYDDAACRGMDPAVFFPDHHGDHRAALAVCATCPVAAHCLLEAMAVGTSLHGIWGGTTERRRRQLRKQGWKGERSWSLRQLTAAQCGTRSGHDRHRRAGEPSCDACRQAYADYQRQYRTARAAR